MGWKTKKGYADKSGVSKDELWQVVTSWLGLKEKQYNSFMAMFFRDFINGKELRPGFVRKMEGANGTTNYLKLEEYNPDEFKFTVSISNEYLDLDTKYLIIRNEITETENGSRWNIEASEKKKSSIIAAIISGSNIDLDSLFHGHIHFNEIS